jgi:two-component SAPR family response regulator
VFENLLFYPSIRVGNTKYRAHRINCHLTIANKIYDKTITTLYDLLILDIKMPTINGFDLYIKIRKIDKNIKVCFLTAGDINYKVFEEVYSTIEKNKFITKPIGNDHLVKKVNELLDSN